MLITTDEKCNNLIKTVRQFYDTITDNKLIYPTEIFVSDNVLIDAKYIFHQPDTEKYNYVEGLCVLPNFSPNKFIILLSYEIYVEDVPKFCFNILHELTHALDYQNYYQMYCNNIIDNIFLSLYYIPFKHYSEYHARIFSVENGMYLLSYDGKKFSYDIKKRKKELMELYLPYYNDLIISKLDNYDMYDITVYCAEYSICNHMNSTLDNGTMFPDKLISKFGVKIYDYYNLLYHIDLNNFARDSQSFFIAYNNLFNDETFN